MRRSWMLPLIAAVFAMPVGYAVAHHAEGDEPSIDAAAEAVPASDCPADVTETYRSAGADFAGFYPKCPTLEEAKQFAQQAQRVAEIRKNVDVIRSTDSPQEAAAAKERIQALVAESNAAEADTTGTTATIGGQK